MNIKNKPKELRQGQRELMNEYLTEVERSDDRALKLAQILRKEDRLFFKILDALFLLLILLGLVYGWTHGAYQKTEITVDCQGVVTEYNNQLPPYNMTLRDLGYTLKTTSYIPTTEQ